MKHPPIIYSEPDFPESVGEYIRADLTPPIRVIHQDGIRYEQTYFAPGEAAVPVGAVQTTPMGTIESFPVIDDQQIKREASSYPPTGIITRATQDDAISAVRSYSTTPRYHIFAALLKFDTSALPDTANIVQATLRLYVQLVRNTNTRSLRAEYYLLDGTDADWTSDGASGVTACEVELSGVTLASNDFQLTNLAGISTTGLTGLRLHITGAVPPGANQVQFASLEHSTQPEPVLLVTYT